MHGMNLKAILANATASMGSILTLLYFYSIGIWLK